jgi:Na+/proline symporter
MIQAVATGHAFEGLTAGVLPFWSGVVFISLVMLVYILTGGWRAVVWTDAIQGVLLTFAIVAAAAYALREAGGAEAVLAHLAVVEPVKFAAPAPAEKLTASWLSLLIVSGIGFAMYPQAIQRIYAAKSEAALKTSYAWMLIVPFVIGSCTLVIGVSGIKLFPGLEGLESDAVFSLLLSRMLSEHYTLVVFILCGLLAAIMSTASSVVLTLASVFTKDIYVPLTGTSPDDAKLARIGRTFTVLILLLVVALSVEQTTSLWRLTEIKVEYLMQLFPPLVLGLYWRRFDRTAALAGLLTGAGVVSGLILAGADRLWLFQAGLWGLIANFAVAAAVTAMSRDDPVERGRVESRFFAPFTAA